MALSRRWALRSALMLAQCLWATVLPAQQDTLTVPQGDSVTVHLVDVDLRTAVQALGRYLDRPVVFGNLGAMRVTIETPQPVPRSSVLGLLRGVLESQNLELHTDSAGLYRVVQREAPNEEAQRAAAAKAARPQGTPELFVIRLSHARASDVAAIVSALYGRASALGEIGERPTTLGDQLRQNLVPPQAPPQAVPGAVGRAATLTGEVTIVPDPATNSLLIRASRADFELIQAAVQELDIRPLQVLIEVLIVEARRDRSFSLGLGASLPETDIGGGVQGTVSGSTEGLGLGDLVVKVMKFGTVGLDATLAAAAARGDVTIVSRPVLLAANNQWADIVVGSQRPFVQVSRSLPTENPVRDQVVQYKDVGTKLHVRPTISADGYVMLEVTQEVNAATTETAFDAPVISTRSVQTELLIKNGQTIVLGGLADRQRDVSKGGVPILSSIPLLGALFGRHARRSIETELFLFITPRTISSDAAADSLTGPLLDRVKKKVP